MAQDYLKKARRCLTESNLAFNEKEYLMAVRRAQESVELSLKAILRFFSIEYPKVHDVSPALPSVQTLSETPEWFKDRIPKFIEISRELSKSRGPALYGLESELKPSSKIFDEIDAKEALESATFVYNSCNKLIFETGKTYSKEKL